MNATAKSGTQSKILVVDDNPIIQRAMYFALRDKGYTVLMVGDVSSALKIVREQHPSAIVLDLNFPPDISLGGSGLRDGFWALDWLKKVEEVKDIPVIVVSSDPPEKSKLHAMASGAAAYFEKPVDKDKLAVTMAALLGTSGLGMPRQAVV